MDIKAQFQKTMNDFKRDYPVKLFKNEEFYNQWIAQTYYFVRHSTALLGYSLPHLKNDQLRHHFEKHLGEETKHDLVAIADLKKMNRLITDYEELHATQAFYQSQYYRISFEGGTSLLGYILFLEGIAVCVGKDIYEGIKDVHKGTSFLRVHAEEDPEHLDSAIKTISSLSEREQEIIMKNFSYSMEVYCWILDKAIQKATVKQAA